MSKLLDDPIRLAAELEPNLVMWDIRFRAIENSLKWQVSP